MATHRVRVTHKELQSRAGKLQKIKQDPEDTHGVEEGQNSRTPKQAEKQRKHRKPDQAIYRPGSFKHGPKSPGEEDSSELDDSIESSKDYHQDKKNYSKEGGDVALSRLNREYVSSNQSPQSDDGSVGSGRRFGPRKQASPAQASIGSKIVSPEKSQEGRKFGPMARGNKKGQTKPKTTISKQGDGGLDFTEELLLDESSTFPPPTKDSKPRKTVTSPNKSAINSKLVLKSESELRRPRGQAPDVAFKPHVDLHLKPREGFSARNLHSENKDLKIHKNPEIDLSPLQANYHLEEEEEEADSFLNRKVNLGGNMRITCTFISTKSSLDSTKLESLKHSSPYEKSKRTEGENFHHNLSEKEKVSSQFDWKKPGTADNNKLRLSGELSGGNKSTQDTLNQENVGSNDLDIDEADWDLEMEKQGYHLETMVISSSSKTRKNHSAERRTERLEKSLVGRGKSGKHVDNKGDRNNVDRKSAFHTDSAVSNVRHSDAVGKQDRQSKERSSKNPGFVSRTDFDDVNMDFKHFEKDNQAEESPKPQRPQRGGRSQKKEQRTKDFVYETKAWMDYEELEEEKSVRMENRLHGHRNDDKVHTRTGKVYESSSRMRHSSENDDMMRLGDEYSDREARYAKDHLSQAQRLRRDSGRSSEGSFSETEKTEAGSTKATGMIFLPQKSSSIDIPKRKDLPVNSSPDTRSPKFNQFTDIYQSPEACSPNLKHSPKPKKDVKQPLQRPPDKKRLWDPSNPNQRPALEEKTSETSNLVFRDPEAVQKSPAGQESGYDSSNFNYPPNVFQPGFFSVQNYPPVPDQVIPPYAPQMVHEGQRSHMTYPPFQQYPQQTMTFDPQQVVSMQSRSQQAAMQVVMQAASKETEFSNVVVHAVQSKESLDYILNIRQELEKLYEAIILLDLETSNQYNIEQLLWKNAYYQLCEMLRKTEDPTNIFKEAFIKLLENGSKFYEDLLTKLQSTYNFKLDTKTGLDPLHEEPRRSIKLAILSAQRCMIALGDIARYKEQANGTSNYGKARSWYSKAQHLVPRNGRPYNQLAILALYTRRKLDAVYYYMRSLGASNPFLSARESLMTIFEEVRKKVEYKEQQVLKAKKEKELADHQRRQRIANQRKGGYETSSARKEVWIHQDGSSSNTKLDEFGEEEGASDEARLEEEKLGSMPPAELNKRFVLSFLNVHGKLFTKIGMEAFSHAAENLLMEFRALLSQTPTPINSTRLLQLMAINMFAVDNTDIKDDKTDCEDMRPYLQELAIQLGLDMFAILAGRCTKQLGDIMVDENSSQQGLSEDLHEILPAVKVFADWMMCHPSLWNPPPNLLEEHLVSKVVVWDVIADLLNIIKDFDDMGIEFIAESDGAQEILLPEDLMLSGFVPLLSLPLKPLYVSKETDKILAMDSVRIISLKLYGEFIYGQETPIITFSVSHNRYISIAPKITRNSPTGSKAVLPESVDDNDDVIIEECTWEEGDVEDNHVSHLKERRSSLERQLREQQNKQQKIQSVIERQKSQRDLLIEIYPVYVVPDTNCFIDQLPYILRLLKSERYLIVVPLVVINELDGLQRGFRGNQAMDASHASRVQGSAKEAIDLLEREFGDRNRNLKALTSKGNLLETIVFRSEDPNQSGNNDDLILKCCLHYCDNNPQQYMPVNKDDKNSPIKLYREVVLLTNDRNLRVKAIQQNVPTKEIMAFVKWAKV